MGRKPGTGSKTNSVASGVATKAGSSSHNFSRIKIDNLDPSFDYSFRLKMDVEKGGGMDRYGYEAVNESNSCGESWASPIAAYSKKRFGTIILEDTVLCKRPLEIKTYWDNENNKRYNSQIRFVNQNSQAAKQKLRNAESALGLENKADVTDSSHFSGPGFTQRPAPTVV